MLHKKLPLVVVAKWRAERSSFNMTDGQTNLFKCPTRTTETDVEQQMLLQVVHLTFVKMCIKATEDHIKQLNRCQP